jgi:tetratricopeptide (TPR) repeat protein
LSIAVRIAEFWHLLKARVAYLAGRRDRARGALKSAIRRNPGSFLAHFMLGRLYWRDRVPVKSKREFDLAWQIDPERFERAYARLQESPDGAPELFTYAAGSNRQEVPVSMSLQDETRSDDFVDDEERRRFSALPPITQDEIHGIDWDRLEEEISRDS